MADEIQSKLSTITTRQKVIMVAFVIVVAFLIWQIIGLFTPTITKKTLVKTTTTTSQISATSPEMSATAPMTALPPGSTAGPSSNPSMMGSSSPNPLLPGAAKDNMVRQAPIVNDPEFLRMQKETEQKYMGKLNELEELKLQRQIAENNQAIAAARLATVTAEKDISDLLTKPTLAPAPVPAIEYSNQLVNPARANQNIPPPPIEEEPETPPPAPYTLISVSMNLGCWSAVVGYQGKLFDVNVGDILPPDGSVISNISRSSITLKRDGQTRRISLVSSI